MFSVMTALQVLDGVLCALTSINVVQNYFYSLTTHKLMRATLADGVSGGAPVARVV